MTQKMLFRHKNDFELINLVIIQCWHKKCSFDTKMIFRSKFCSEFSLENRRRSSFKEIFLDYFVDYTFWYFRIELFFVEFVSGVFYFVKQRKIKLVAYYVYPLCFPFQHPFSIRLFCFQIKSQIKKLSKKYNFDEVFIK